ncbi:MAG: succinate dehydrogenase assembly factor 2 [Pseudomonadota bacterium]
MSGEAALDRDARLRRLRIRCWRRGTKEMDLILGGFFDRRGATLSDAALTEFEALIEEDDDRLYRWACGAEAPPERHAAMLERIQRDSEVKRSDS